ncbi:MAG: hypothetical protein H8E37_01970 [Planctomycetes bacterium]|nr:hypothetical protein [Planctomycetota bacterium]
MPRDLETVCLKCLEKDPGQRYQTAGDLLADLRAFLDSRPVQARPVGKLGTLVRWAKRKPVIAGLSVAVILATAGGVSGIAWQWQEAQANFRQSQTYLGEANKNLEAAKTAQDAAEGSEKAAVAARKKTEEAKQLADQRRDEAEKSFGLARATLYRFVTQVPNHELLKKPGLEEVKRDLQTLGRDYYLKLVEARPDDLKVKFELALNRFFLAMTFEDMGQNHDAAAEYLAASELMQEQLEADPTRVRNRRNLAACLGNLANVQIAIGQRGEGIKSYRKILVIQKKLVEENPDDSTSELHMAMTMLNLGSLEYDEKRYEAALKTLEETRVIGDRLLSEHAGDPNVQLFSGETSHFLGRCQRELKKPALALDHLQQAASVFQEFVDRQPDDVRSHEKLSGVWADIAHLHFQEQDQAKTEAAWTTSLAHAETAHSKAPQVSIFRNQLSRRLSSRAYHRCTWGELEPALTDITKARQLLAGSSLYSYNTARGLADFITAMDTSEKPMPPEVLSQRGAVLAKAFVWLNEAINIGFHDVAAFESEPSWNRLKDLPEYLAALRKMKAAQIKAAAEEPAE